MFATVIKERLVNVRLKEKTHQEFKIACELRGASMSSLLHQFIVRTIREEKEHSPHSFEIEVPTRHFAPVVATISPAVPQLSREEIRRTINADEIGEIEHRLGPDKESPCAQEKGEMMDELLIRQIAEIKAYQFLTLSLVRYHVDHTLRNDGQESDLKAHVQGWIDHLTGVFEADLRAMTGLAPQTSAAKSPPDLSDWPDVLDSIGNDPPADDGD